MKTTWKHTFALVLLASGCIQQTERTLEELDQGEQPEIPKVISLRMSKYRPQPGRQFKEIFVSNFSAGVARGLPFESEGRDGLSNELKSKVAPLYGFALDGPHTANPLFSDLMIYLSGIRYAQQTFLHCSSSLVESASKDIIKYMDNRVQPPRLTYLGLRDCEKSYLGLRPDQFDFDKDLIPDYLELRCGLNPRNGSDAALSLTGDGLNNLEKCKRHIPIDESGNSQSNKLYGYRYKIEVDVNSNDRVIRVDNIPVLKNDRQNLIAIYIVEIDPATTRTYLMTAWSLITPKAIGLNAYEFDYWATQNVATHQNQEVQFP